MQSCLHELVVRHASKIFSLLSTATQAAEHMRDTFEQHGAAWFAPCAEAHAGPTFQAASEPKPAAAGAAAAAEQQQEQQEEEQQQEPAAPEWQSQWAAQGWLSDNPLVSAPPLLLWHHEPQCCPALHCPGGVPSTCSAVDALLPPSSSRRRACPRSERC